MAYSTFCAKYLNKTQNDIKRSVETLVRKDQTIGNRSARFYEKQDEFEIQTIVRVNMAVMVSLKTDFFKNP